MDLPLCFLEGLHVQTMAVLRAVHAAKTIVPEHPAVMNELAQLLLFLIIGKAIASKAATDVARTEANSFIATAAERELSWGDGDERRRRQQGEGLGEELKDWVKEGDGKKHHGRY